MVPWPRQCRLSSWEKRGPTRKPGLLPQRTVPSFQWRYPHLEYLGQERTFFPGKPCIPTITRLPWKLFHWTESGPVLALGNRKWEYKSSFQKTAGFPFALGRTSNIGKSREVMPVSPWISLEGLSWSTTQKGRKSSPPGMGKPFSPAALKAGLPFPLLSYLKEWRSLLFLLAESPVRRPMGTLRSIFGRVRELGGGDAGNSIPSSEFSYPGFFRRPQEMP